MGTSFRNLTIHFSKDKAFALVSLIIPEKAELPNPQPLSEDTAALLSGMAGLEDVV